MKKEGKVSAPVCSKFCSEPDLDAGISLPAVVGVAGRWVNILRPYRKVFLELK